MMVIIAVCHWSLRKHLGQNEIQEVRLNMMVYCGLSLVPRENT